MEMPAVFRITRPGLAHTPAVILGVPAGLLDMPAVFWVTAAVILGMPAGL